MVLLASATRILLFTGKGGVGKTSIACATALSLADAGKKVLLVSTDPASNLNEVLETEIGMVQTPIPGASTLEAINIDPVRAAHAYKERVVAPYRQLLPEAAIESIEEQLSGACTVEIAAFDEFAKLLGDDNATSDFDHVIFDTAPTGHTLRLLELPTVWTDFIAKNSSGTSCLGPLAGLSAQRDLYEKTVHALRDGSKTTVFLVSRPDRTALDEADRTKRELSALGITNLALAINGVFEANDLGDVIAAALQERGREALSAMPSGLRKLGHRVEIPLVAYPLIGVENLRRFIQGADALPRMSVQRSHPELPSSLDSLIADLAHSGRGVIMTMGKGGVGKTTIAAQIALELASMDYPVHLTTTDPAAHVLDAAGNGNRNLRVTRIDPAVEVRQYCEEVMATAGKDLDDAGRSLLEEDLRSPCTSEIAVFRAFARTVDEGNDGFVVIDTAPTGHTLLLLDAANAYHREVERNLSHVPDAVRRLLPRLRDREFTKILIVTLPEATPVHEAAQLQQDLERASIHPYAWVINQSLLASGTRDPILAERGQREIRFIDEVRNQHAENVVLIPWKLAWRPGEDISAELAKAGVNCD